MKTETLSWKEKWGKWDKPAGLNAAQLVLYFYGKGIPDLATRYQELKEFYPKAHLLGCSTGGEIYGEDVRDNSISAAAVCFDKTTLLTAKTKIGNAANSFKAGKELANMLNKPDLRSIFLLSDGTNVNGSDLVNGLYSVIDEKVIVTGGLAGDAADFQTTYVGLDAMPETKIIGAVGLYGDHIKVGYGSVGGWSPFGPERKVTKSKDNVLYELDGKPALDLYKQYLGEEAKNLPGSALFFPLSIKPDTHSEHNIVRTSLSVDEKEKTMTFAGDMPEGYVAQLMHGNFDNLVEGAAEAAGLANLGKPRHDSLAILVSCIGRKLLLGQSITDETEAVAEVFKHTIPTIGFYSYGEICHQQFTGKCGLHNQTMTVTLLHE